jgi:hypothetical protein
MAFYGFLWLFQVYSSFFFLLRLSSFWEGPPGKLSEAFYFACR